jgi:hypothetical protein
MTVRGLDSSHRSIESGFSGLRIFESAQAIGKGCATIDSASEICGPKYFSGGESVLLNHPKFGPEGLRVAWPTAAARDSTSARLSRAS